jgi:Gas vesicle protein G
MGLFTGLLTLPLAPVRGVAWIVEQVVEEADRRLYDEQSIRRELLELELDYEDGRISREEREACEEALMERLAIGQARIAAAREGVEDG